jgi:hypothetical protein
VLTPGATTFEFSYGFNTHVETIDDMMGNITHERTGFADDRTPELGVSHAFGRFEVGAFIDNEVMRATLDVDTRAIPGTVYFNANFSWFTDGTYRHSQEVGAHHQIVVAPGRLSIRAGAVVRVWEARLNVVGMPSMQEKGTMITASAGAGPAVQLGGPFAMHGAFFVGAPLWQSQDYGGRVALGANTFLLLALRKWDFYVGGALNDITRAYPSTYFTLGFRKRWGL